MFKSGFLVLCFCSLALSAPKLPESIPRCKRNDPKLSECLRSAVQVMIEQSYEKGIPKLGVFALDPLKFTALDVAQGKGNGPVSIDLKFRDLSLTGLKSATITNVIPDLDNYKIEIQGYFEVPVIIDSEYELSGKVLVLPLAGKGKSHFVLSNVKASIKLEGKEIKKNGRVYMQVERLDVDYDLSGLDMNFEGLLSSDKNLGANMNKFMNENWEEIHKEVKPGIKKALGVALKEIASRIFSKIPYDDIFLP